MKILFVHIMCAGPNLMLNYSFGITSMAAVLKQSGHSTSYFPILCSEFLNKKNRIKTKLNSKIKDFEPDVIGISCMSDGFNVTKEIVKYFDQLFPNIFVILGGIHATSAPENTIKIKGVSAICLGEGELALRELLDKMQNKQPYLDTQNFWFKMNRKIIKNPQRNLISNLDNLPFEDMEILEKTRFIEPYKRTKNRVFPELGSDGQADIMTSRGCPGNCHYCFNSTLKSLYKNDPSFYRRHSVQYVIEQIKHIKKRYKISKIHFWDDSFTDDLEWLKIFSKKYNKEIHMPFRCIVRPNLTEEKVILLKNACCHTINIGVECGNDSIRNKMLNRPWTKKQIIKSCSLIKKHNLLLYVFSMVGCPGETEATLKETYDLIKKIKPDSSIHCSIFKPYPGTKSYLLCKHKGWLKQKNFYGYFSDSQLKLPKLSASMIKKYQYKIQALSNDPLISF